MAADLRSVSSFSSPPRIHQGGPDQRKTFFFSSLLGQGPGESRRSVPSVLINPKDPDAVQLGQLGNQHGEQGNGVDHKMDAVVFGVEAGQYVPEERRQARKTETSGQWWTVDRELRDAHVCPWGWWVSDGGLKDRKHQEIQLLHTSFFWKGNNHSAVHLHFCFHKFRKDKLLRLMRSDEESYF